MASENPNISPSSHNKNSNEYRTIKTKKKTDPLFQKGGKVNSTK
jgi:hypothetical protein